jgi:hypothetical protein
LLLFAILTCFALVPLAAASLLAEEPPSQWTLLEAEAHSRALALDATVERLLPAVRERADEIAALLAQLPPGPFGKAAEGTLLLHLERKLAADRDNDRYLVLAPDGRVLLATGKTGPATAESLPEVAQAAQRPAAVVVRALGGRASLVVAAPYRRGAALGGLFVARVRGALVERMLAAAGGVRQLNVIDASGLGLLPSAEGGLREGLGLESRPGRGTAASGTRYAYQPLQTARAVLVATAPPPELPRVRAWQLAAAAGVLAAIVAWLLARSIS